jgi:hypothetical protein
MRPVDRGAWPQEHGQNITFREHADARRWLYERLAMYCSYCNRRLESGAVEHVRPKKPAGVYYPNRATDWNNFLLACVNCNSHKGQTDVNLTDYFWPDRDNTMLAVEYNDSGSVGVPSALVGTPQADIAKRTLELTGLDFVPKLDAQQNIPTAETDPQATDTRWERRRKVWLKALDARNDLQQFPTDAMRRRVISEVEEAGYWPIWYRHLADLPGMRDALVNLHAGTVAACFAANGTLVARAGGLL